MFGLEPEVIATLIAAVIGLGGALAAALLQVRGQKPTQTLDAPKDDPRLEKVLTTARLNIGCVKHAPLCDFHRVGDHYVFSGVYVEIAEVVGKAYGLDISFVPIEWSELRYSFDRYNADLVLSVFETAGRLEQADFVAPLHRVGVGGIVRAGDDRFSTVRDLRRPGIRIAVSRGEAGWEYVRRDLKLERDRTIVIDSADLFDTLDSVRSGRADIAICDDVTCDAYIQMHGDMTHVFRDNSVYKCKNAIMVPRGDREFAEWVDRVFRDAIETPEGEEIEKRLLDGFERLIERHT